MHKVDADLRLLLEQRSPNLPNNNIKNNDSCWCKSGRKFKNCHRGRESLPRPNGFEMSKRVRGIFQNGECLHPARVESPCSTNKAIRSHTVQKAGGLSALAEKGHVYTSLVHFEDMEKAGGKPGLRRVGLNNASTFPGFCSKHDSSIFSEIEDSIFRIDRFRAFLFAYRAICYEIQRKKSAISVNRILMDEADAGLPVQLQYQIQDHLAAFNLGTELGLMDLVLYKKEYDDVLISKDYSKAEYLALEFDGQLPLAVSASHIPVYDFQGNFLQDLGDTKSKLEGITITITSFSGKSFLIFAWLGRNDGSAAKFAKSFVSIPVEDRASAAICAAFSLSENSFVQPSWWEGLPQEGRDFLLDRREDNSPFKPDSDNWLYKYKKGFSAIETKSVIGSLPGSVLWR